MQLTSSSYSQNNTEKFCNMSDILDNSKGDSEEDINSQKYFKLKKEERLPRNRNEAVC
jgi:hypothetical protein